VTDDPHRVLEELSGPLPTDPAADQAADRAVRVLHAQSAALAWVRQATGTYPAPPAVARLLADTAAEHQATTAA
jgi:hypothetical protein